MSFPPIAVAVFASLTSGLLAQFAPLVNGVNAVASPGASGPLFPLVEEWQTIVGGDADTSPQPCIFAAARTFDGGRVVAWGHDGIFQPASYAQLDNGVMLRNMVAWLDVAGAKQVGYSSGHREWIGGAQLSSLSTALSAEGYTFAAVPGPITAAALAGKSVLIVGNAWDAFTAAEIEAVRLFVTGGGGLCLVGLGWSWEPYHPGLTLDDYPMSQMAAPYGMWWQRQVIFDPTDQFNGDPRYHVFYPQAANVSVAGAQEVIATAHATHGANLPAQLESDASLRAAVLGAHTVLASVARELSATHPARNEVFDFHTALMKQWPDYYARGSGVSLTLYPNTVLTRERSWVTLRDLLPLTPERTARIAAAGQLTGRYRDLLDDFGMVLLDNVQLAPEQLDYLHRILTLIPTGMHHLRSVSVYDFLEAPAVPQVRNYLDRQMGTVNIFGLGIESASENSFPYGEVPAGTMPVFCAAVAHEFNHVVEAYRIHGVTALLDRQTQLIAQAGTDRFNYLRSMFENGVFFNAPQEFFASISNQWFTDSAKTLELGVLRFQAGRPEPLNQALFFAEVYAQGGTNTWFYFTDTHGTLQRRSIPLTRNGAGHIDSLTVGPRTYTFTLDAAGNVTGLTLGDPGPPAVIVWPDPAVVREDRAGMALVQLATAPAGNVVVSIEHTAGDADLAGSGTFTFTPTNWNFPQALTLFATPDADIANGSATFTATAAGFATTGFTVTESDDDTPALTLTAELDAGHAAFTYSRAKVLTDIAYIVEISPDLYVWNADPQLTEQTVIADDGTTQLVRARAVQSLAASPRLFLRLRQRR